MSTAVITLHAKEHNGTAAAHAFHEPIAYDGRSHTGLPAPYPSAPFQRRVSPLLFSPLRAAITPDPLLDPFPDSPLTFDTLHDYGALDSPLPLLSNGDDSNSTSSISSLPAIDSSPATSFPAPHTVSMEPSTAAGTLKARRRRGERSSGDRLQRKRRKQRECDVDRRHRENTAFIQLQQLIREEEQHTSTDEQPQQPDVTGDTSSSNSKLHKADILQQSVQLIEVLKRRVAELTEGSTATPPANHPPPSSTQLALSHAASSTLAAHLRHSSLHSPMRDHSTVCLILLQPSTNRIIDVTSRFLACTGWQRTHIVGRRWPKLHTKRDVGRRAVVLRDDAVLVEGGGGMLVPSRQEPQYERSIRLREQLYSGEVDRIEAVWRAQLADGRLYEFQATSWVSEWEEVECGGGQGGLKRQACQAMSVVGGTQIVCVE